jgi:hypothetical protein
MTEMDYFSQKPEMDMSGFFKTRGLRMAEAPVPTIAPPPKDTAWVAPVSPSEEE